MDDVRFSTFESYVQLNELHKLRRGENKNKIIPD